uniref:Copper-containing nitrite reductase n=1 Tax=Steinernema glaseri TaxID=37863 RepID=A0A1I7YGQ0_9BILA
SAVMHNTTMGEDLCQREKLAPVIRAPTSTDSLKKPPHGETTYDMYLHDSWCAL